MTMTNRAMDWLAERGLDAELADRMGLASGKRGGGEALILPTTRDGRIVARKFRLFDNPDQRWATDGETCFWNEDVLRDTSLDHHPLIITEGHWDALAAIQCGFPRTVSVPNGAPPPANDDRDPNEQDRYAFVRSIAAVLTKDRFPTIIIAADADGPGHQLLHDLSVQLGRYRCKYLTYEALDPMDADVKAKDLNDVLQRDGPAGVTSCISRARFVAIKGLSLAKDLPPVSPETVYEIGDDARGLALFSQNYKMRLGDLCVVTGVPGFGKTAFVHDVCCRVADHYGVRVAWASFEQTPQVDQVRAFRQWLRSGTDDHLSDADCDRWIDDHHVMIVPPEDDDVSFDWLLETMEGAVSRFDARVIVIDPWNEIEHRPEPGETETVYTSRAIRTLKRFAKRFRIHLIVVAHPSKLQKEKGRYNMPGLYDISGSSHWYNKADIGIIVHRESADSTMLKVQKSRHHDRIGKPGEVSVDYSWQTRRFVEKERLA